MQVAAPPRGGRVTLVAMRLALSVVVLAACTHHYDINDAHELVGEGEVTVELAGRKRVPATVFESGGYVAFVGSDGVPIPFDHIVRVTGRNRMRGAGDGVVVGALGGAVAGLVAGAALSDSDDDCDDSSHASSNCGFAAFGAIGDGILGGLIGAAGGGLLGLAIGAATGSTVIYENKHAHAVVRVGGPPGSVAGLAIDF